MGYTNTQGAVKTHCQSPRLLKYKEVDGMEIQPRGLTIIPDTDLLALVRNSKLPIAKAFGAWVEETVLPAVWQPAPFEMDFEDMWEAATPVEEAMEEPPTEIKDLVTLDHSLVTPDHNLVTLNKDKVPVTTSVIIAKEFGKRHDNVVQAIKNLKFPENRPDFGALNFKATYYIDASNREKPMYEVTEDGTMLLVMGFTGEKALEIKLRFIEEFKRMKEHILKLERMPFDPSKITKLEALKMAIESEEARLRLEQKIEEDRPKVESYNELQLWEGNFGMRETAKMLGAGPNKFTAALRRGGYFFQCKKLIPMQKYMDLGWFIVRTVKNEQTNTWHTQAFTTPLGVEGLRRDIKSGKLLVGPLNDNWSDEQDGPPELMTYGGKN